MLISSSQSLWCCNRQRSRLTLFDHNGDATFLPFAASSDDRCMEVYEVILPDRTKSGLRGAKCYGEYDNANYMIHEGKLIDLIPTYLNAVSYG